MDRLDKLERCWNLVSLIKKNWSYQIPELRDWDFSVDDSTFQCSSNDFSFFKIEIKEFLAYLGYSVEDSSSSGWLNDAVSILESELSVAELAGLQGGSFAEPAPVAVLAAYLQEMFALTQGSSTAVLTNALDFGAEKVFQLIEKNPPLLACSTLDGTYAFLQSKECRKLSASIDKEYSMRKDALLHRFLVTVRSMMALAKDDKKFCDCARSALSLVYSSHLSSLEMHSLADAYYTCLKRE